MRWRLSEENTLFSTFRVWQTLPRTVRNYNFFFFFFLVKKLFSSPLNCRPGNSLLWLAFVLPIFCESVSLCKDPFGWRQTNLVTESALKLEVGSQSNSDSGQKFRRLRKGKRHLKDSSQRHRSRERFRYAHETLIKEVPLGWKGYLWETWEKKSWEVKPRTSLLDVELF